MIVCSSDTQHVSPNLHTVVNHKNSSNYSSQTAKACAYDRPNRSPPLCYIYGFTTYMNGNPKSSRKVVLALGTRVELSLPHLCCQSPKTALLPLIKSR